MIEYIKEYLKNEDIKYKENKNLKDYSHIKIGGIARIVILPENMSEFIKILKFLDGNKTKYKILGNMSNVLPRDTVYETVIIKTDKVNKICFGAGCCLCDCGVRLPFLSWRYCDLGFSGLEELSGIPGQLGGAVYANAGAFGREISDVLSECYVYEKSGGEILRLSASELGFGYRKSNISYKGFVLLSVKLKALAADKENIKKRTKDYREIRKQSQPYEFPSLGSVFKRPSDGISAGKLIDECGLKGYSLGDAEISSKHAGFIINRGCASSDDVKSLAEIASEAVFKKFGIVLEREIEYL